MRTYSSDTVGLTWLGLDLKPGFASGTFLSDSNDNPTWTYKTSASGELHRAFSASRSGMLSITMDQESFVHQQLLAIAAQDRRTHDQVGNGRFTDASLGLVIEYQNMSIETEPSETRGTESATLVWTMKYESRIFTPATVSKNSVGN